MPPVARACGRLRVIAYLARRVIGGRPRFRRTELQPVKHGDTLMGKAEKLLKSVLAGTSDTNVCFQDLCNLLKRLGFAERIRGDHFIFTRPDIEEILNLQPVNSKAKPYQVKQVRGVILRYKLGESDVS
jgi:hypothetical protein